MEDKEIMQEIAELRKQLQAVSTARGQEPKEEPAQEQGAAAGGEAGDWLKEIMKQAEDLIGGMDMHLKDVPAKTALVIFTLGVLTGRLLSRRG